MSIKYINIGGKTYEINLPHSLIVNGTTFDGSKDIEITPALLGLDNALHFKGVVSSLPETAANGDVYLVGNKEYVYSNGWVELGDGDSHALKTITISAGEGLTGGGSLAANRTISLSEATKTSLGKADSAIQEITAVAGNNINEVGTPTVQASTSNNKTTLTFNYLKGKDGVDGEDAIILSVTSSNGVIFKNSEISTTLTAHVFRAGQELTDEEVAEIGKICWYNSATQEKVHEGLNFIIEAGDVGEVITYIAQLETLN